MPDSLHASVALDALRVGWFAGTRRVGGCYDNATIESLWPTLKKDLMHVRRFRARGGAHGGFRMDRGLVPTNENQRLTRLRQPRCIRGGRESRVGPTRLPTCRVQVHFRR